MKSDNIYSEYSDFLKTIKSDSQAFLHFKRDKSFMAILEHVSQQSGTEYKHLIENEFSDDVANYLDIVTLNDSIGDPVKHSYAGVEMSPTNLRYIYQSLLILDKCKRWFPSKKNVKIIEIGGGYGGLSLFIQKMFKDYVIEYTIVDLPDPKALQEKFLSSVGLQKTRTVSCFDINQLANEKFDLVISNYCISEISVQNKNEYFEKIIKNCDKKFFAWNYLTVESDSVIWKYLKVKKVLALLGVYPPVRYISKKEYIIEEERPQTGYVNTFIYSK
jgi:putative sugar O-methyltransferase